MSLDQLGIVGLNVEASASVEMNEGNRLGLVSSYSRADGGEGDMADVWVVRQDAMPAQTPSLGELLAEPGPSLPGADASQVTALAGAEPSLLPEPVSQEIPDVTPLI